MYSSREFHKSSYSPNESACVEVAEGAVTAVRDTQNRENGALMFPSAEWQALLGAARREA
ncbi:DUF397 domain-containing protein [Nocardiopsis ganjiahuensis]|uniref:DUF397 domain-containing protein n=1 Tax=Nocardiopsis ganjiahuensis TaxID=239984 RepID=UPI0009FD96B7|nr:DUF397 domain-containing protein [Nocardiopsis ganjiahuensis]